MTNLPVMVGFGVSKVEHVVEIRAFADGFVIASKILSLLSGPVPAVGVAEEYVKTIVAEKNRVVVKGMSNSSLL